MTKPAGASLLAKITDNKDHSAYTSGFTLIEMIMIIMLLSILSVTAVVKWPSGMDTEAAALEFKRAVRYAQHRAMTREFTAAASAWGLSVTADKYTIQRRDGTEPVPDFSDRYLLGDSAVTISGGPASPATGLWFNGLGEPIDGTGAPSGVVTYTIAGTENMTICPQTGYIVRGATCP
jgi:type II secretory pathway pseudopilin PulG